MLWKKSDIYSTFNSFDQLQRYKFSSKTDVSITIGMSTIILLENTIELIFFDQTNQIVNTFELHRIEWSLILNGIFHCMHKLSRKPINDAKNARALRAV